MNYTSHPGLKASPANLPKHIAIIMDGNGRWARQQGLSRTMGHRKGVQVARDIINLCQKKPIPVLTLFAFGMENWKRPTQEVRNLFRLFFLALRKEIHRLHDNNIKLKIIGDRTVFNKRLLSAIVDAEKLTAQNTGLALNIAVNYSGRWDLMHAIQKIIKDSPATISEQMLSDALSLQGIAEPDLFIRTGGVQRISNFMLWELAYTELFFTPTLWPDFNEVEMEQALSDYALRERRFGLTGEQIG